MWWNRKCHVTELKPLLDSALQGSLSFWFLLSVSRENVDQEISLQQMYGKVQGVNERSQWEKSFDFFWHSCTKKYCFTEDSELRRFQGSLQPAYCFSTACCKQYTVLKISRNAHSPWRAGVCKVVKNHFRSWKRKLISRDSAYSTLERAHWTCRYCHRCTIRVSI